MFIDASAIVAILTREDGHGRLMEHLCDAPRRMTSGLAVFEAVLAITRIQSVPPTVAEAVVDSFLETMRIALIPITAPETRAALAAHARYGKGHHRARLNLGDCFAYACARTHGVPLLFVGDDFPQTDITPALA